MVSKQILDIVSMTLNDMDRTDLFPGYFFSKKFMILGGDLRQILTVVPGGGRAEIVRACFKSSDSWRYGKFRKYHLTQNMRVNPAEKDFARFLLQVGNGELNVRVPNVTDNALAFPPELILPWSDYEDNELELIKFVFAEHLTKESVRDVRAAHHSLSHQNEACMRINNRIIETILEGPSREYFSGDKFLDPQRNESVINLRASASEYAAAQAAVDR